MVDRGGRGSNRFPGNWTGAPDHPSPLPSLRSPLPERRVSSEGGGSHNLGTRNMHPARPVREGHLIRSLYTVIRCRYTPRPSKRPWIARTRGEASGHRHRVPAFVPERHPVRDSDESCQQHWRIEIPPPRLPSRQTTWPSLRDLQEQSEVQSPPRWREGQKDPPLGCGWPARAVGCVRQASGIHGPSEWIATIGSRLRLSIFLCASCTQCQIRARRFRG
ncbi:hypothetical protein Mal15_28640 [Stieleria maiorica]|uniref:Uncharacterized protein n=1 Tax=Stieleria maiorica TaxID=2795974 RepID=A0A5B9MIG0_9BACT|nr:hypothetical protein Mal15_28640 [Stieleria maiorica]